MKTSQNSEIRIQKSEGKIQKSLNFSAILLSLLFLVFVLSATASAELTATANHDLIKIDFLYHGSTLSIRGTSDPGTDLIVKITSPEGHQALKTKGKVGGVLWMNVGEMKFEHVPSFYAIHSTKNLDDILSVEERDKYVLGYPALERHIEVSPVSSQEEKDTWFKEFIRYKEDSKLYSSSTGTLTLTDSNGKQNYYVLTEWPYQAQPGEYLVTVYAVKDKKVIEKADAKVKVEQTGIVKTLAGMAKNRASVYGLLAILAALGAGFGVGLIFRKGGGAH